MKMLLIIIVLLGLPMCIAEGVENGKETTLKLPDGWRLRGSNPKGYDSGVTYSTGNPAPSGFMVSNNKVQENEFGTVMQSFIPDEYLGKRIKLIGWVKSERVEDWAGVWMRIDKGSKTIGFDNMANRPIKGTTEWTQYEVVLDVEKEATNISFGVLLVNTGKVWFDEFSIEVVNKSIPLTSVPQKGIKNSSF